MSLSILKIFNSKQKVKITQISFNFLRPWPPCCDELFFICLRFCRSIGLLQGGDFVTSLVKKQQMKNSTNHIAVRQCCWHFVWPIKIRISCMICLQFEITTTALQDSRLWTNYLDDSRKILISFWNSMNFSVLIFRWSIHVPINFKFKSQDAIKTH